MQAPFQIVGCVLASTPSAELIDALVAQVRLERAVVVTKTAQSATFVRLGAQDAALITLACRTQRAQSRPRLRFGFVAGSKTRAKAEARACGEEPSANDHGIAQASDLAAGADDGEVLVLPQLAVLLIESGFALRSKQVRLTDGRTVTACKLDLTARAADRAERQDAIDGLDRRLGQLHKATEELEHNLATQLQQRAGADDIERNLERLRADLQVLTDRRAQVADLPATVDGLLGRVNAFEDKIAALESRRQVVEDVQSRADTIVHMLGDIHLKLEMLNEQRAVIDHVGDKLARLDFTLQEAQNTLRALQREREMAERIEQGIKALRTRSSAAAVGADGKP